MKRSTSSGLRRLRAVLAAGTIVAAATAVLGDAPAFAAPAHSSAPASGSASAHRPKLTANQIAGKAITDLKSASSVRVYSRDSELGLTEATHETYADSGCLAAISIAGGGTSISEKVLIVGTSAWVQLGNAFWRELGYTGTELTSLEGKWVTFAAFEKLFKISGLPSTSARCTIKASGTTLPRHGWTLGKSVKLSGRWAWRLTSKPPASTCRKLPGIKCGLLTTNAYVSDTRKPELLRLSLFGITEHFYAYNVPVTLTAPPADDVLTSVPPPPGGIPLGVRSLALLAHAV